MCLQLPGCLMLKGTDPKLFFRKNLYGLYLFIEKWEICIFYVI